MATDKKSFLLYADTIHTVRKLTDEQAGRLFKHVLAYVNDENPTTDDILIEVAFEPIKQSLKRDLKKYEKIKLLRSKAGKASAASKSENKQVLTHVKNVKQNSTHSTVNDSVSVSVNDSIINKKKNIDTSFILPDISFKEIVDQWLLFRKELKKPFKTQKGVEQFYIQLKKLSNNSPLIAQQIINQSISNEWQGIFELKASKPEKQEMAR